MEISDAEEDQFVTDAGHRDWGVGVVRSVIKTRVYVYWKSQKRTVVYGEDIIHALNLRTGHRM